MNAKLGGLRPVSIPATREEAIEAIVALGAAQWGWDEAERGANAQYLSDLSYGLLLLRLAHDPTYGYGADVPHLVAAALAALTPEDRVFMRRNQLPAERHADLGEPRREVAQ